MPVSAREPTVSAFQVRPALPQDMDQLCELASDLLMNIRAEGNVEDARRL